jgi:AcrR family transcriptional regulator
VARPTVRPLRREQILDVAQRLIGERGWAGLTFATLCQEAGISNGVLTYHFHDKDDLLFALFERRIARMREQCLAPFVTGEGSLRERLQILVGSMPDHGTERRDYRLLHLHFLSRSVDRPEIAERFRTLYAERLQDIAGRLRKDAAAGIIVRDPGTAAAMIIGVLAGFSTIHSTINTAPPHAEMVELLYTYLTNGGEGRGQ